MTSTVEQALDDLRVAAPPSLRGRVLATWVGVAGPVGEVFVASTDRGIAKDEGGHDQLTENPNTEYID